MPLHGKPTEKIWRKLPTQSSYEIKKRKKDYRHYGDYGTWYQVKGREYEYLDTRTENL